MALEDLTGQKVSLTYGRLIQKVDSSYYDGFGNSIEMADVSILNSMLTNYINDSSLSDSTFVWTNGYLDVSVIGGSGVSQGYVDASLMSIRANYIPDASLNDAYFKWINGFLEPSVASGTGDVTKSYVDASLVDIRENYVKNSSIGSESFFYDSSGYLQTLENSGIGIIGKWKFKTGTGDTDPGSGYFKLNDIDPSSSTYIYMSDYTVAGSDIQNIISQLKKDDFIYVQRLTESIESIYYKLSADPIDAGQYTKIPVQCSNQGPGPFTNNKEYGFILYFSARNEYTTFEYVDGSLSNKSDINHLHDTRYVKEASLSGEFVWSGGALYVDVSVIANGAGLIYVDGSLAKRDASINWLYDHRLDPSLDYTTYTPRVSDVSFVYDGDNVSEIITRTDLGIKTVSFLYNDLGDASTINIDNYGLWQRTVTFEKDINDNIIAVHIS